MKRLGCVAVLLVAALGCGGKAAFQLPAMDISGVAVAGSAAGARDAGPALVAECDQAQDGTACGAAGQLLHCIYNVCVRNVCGDGVRAEAELCDDGNERDHDGCDAHCRTEPPAACGDGQVDPGEACDDGNRVDTDLCTNTCQYARCGDGISGPDEECDDANPINSDACLDNCRRARCGDGFVGPGELCDDGNANDADGCGNDCRIPSAACGNGAVESGEACDDGNAVDTDGCTNACKTAVCGDGFVQAGVELCDDGNTNDTDACTSLCKAARCGDGIVGSGEACDDGNTNDTDACSNACTIPATVPPTCSTPDCLSAPDKCLACEVANCSDYLGLGSIDLVAACYHDPDPTNVQLCVDVITCARVNKCAYTSRGAEQCYCGNASSASCSQGIGIDGVCRSKFEAAAGNSSAMFVTNNFGNRSLPIGNAVLMLACDRDFCASTVPGDLCTP